MLILKKFEAETVEGTWTDFEVWGAKIGIKIRPRTNEVIQQIRKKHRTKKRGEWVFDEEAIADEVMDYIVEDFRGVGDENGVAYEVNLENKKLVMAVPVPVGEQSLYLRVIDRANELGLEVREDEIKN